MMIAYLQVGPIPLGCALECQPIQICHMGGPDIHPPILAATRNDYADHRLLRCRYILPSLPLAKAQ